MQRPWVHAAKEKTSMRNILLDLAYQQAAWGLPSALLCSRKVHMRQSPSLAG